MRPTHALLLVAMLVAACSPSRVGTTPPTAISTIAPTPTVAATASLDPLASVRKPITQLGQRLEATVQVGGEPEWIGSGTDAVWVTNRLGSGSVQRIDPEASKVVASVQVSEPCNGFAIGFGAIWTASCADQTLVRIDPTRNVVVAAIPSRVAADGEGQVAAGFGSIWIAGGDGALKRLDPKTNTFIASIVIPTGADAVVSGPGGIWVTDPDGNGVLKIDPATDKPAGEIAVGPHPQFLAADDTSIWVLNQDDGTVSRVDPGSELVIPVATQSTGRDVGCIGAGLGAGWVTVPKLPLTRIDAWTNTVTEQFDGAGGDCLTTGFGSIWLVNNALGTVFRIAPP